MGCNRIARSVAAVAMATIFVALLAAVGALLLSAHAEAACNEICRAKCRATAALAGQTFDQCVAIWSKVNLANDLACKGDAGCRAKRGAIAEANSRAMLNK